MRAFWPVSSAVRNSGGGNRLLDFVPLNSSSKKTDSFYFSPEWKALRLQALKRDHFRCVICGVYVGGKGDSRVDHTKTRREAPNLALDLDNLRTLCALHDNQSHREKGGGGGARIERFSGCDADGWPLGSAQQKTPWTDERSAPHPEWIGRSLIPVNLVCGPPASGKMIFVQENAASNDLILDLDLIIAEISGDKTHGSWDRRKWLDAALQRRNELLDSLSRSSEWPQAWLIVGEPTAERRAWWRKTLGPGKTFVLLTPPEECDARITQDQSRVNVQAQHRAAVRLWWTKYRPELNDLSVRRFPSSPS